METVLSTNALTKTFSGHAAVNQVTMQVRKGDIYGFIGKNGAGKTTLMRMAAGLARPTRGSIALFGDTDLKKNLHRTGCAIESPSLYPSLTAIQNLEVYQKMLGIPKKSCVTEILQTVGLQDTGKKTAKHFSMGMRQRLAIAIALLGSPDFLILDEPINGLDPTGIKDIRDLLLKLNREQGITILVSSHILGELAKIATCYGIINNGYLVDQFSAEELETRCRRCLRIQVDDVRKASHIIETILGTVNYDVLPGNIIRLFDYVDASDHVNAELIKNGVSVLSLLSAGQDLEGYFMELMGGMRYA